MSTTAQGSISATSSTRFTATFVLPGSGLQANFAGDFSSSVQTFNSANAVVTYNKESDLTGTREFSGQIGVTNIKLTLTNGVTIQGILDMPISPADSVSGSGVWDQN
ncbi:hypothetical protein JR316_0009170 [Psilocybe cubensis]|uniref:Uncharacterized protein n=2 Tax=Psilocybe cubensis TaxID=181762 RepID=A0A8H8CKF3_PSICU|nr:hypothetical protein JR316_0009170 [Psilocybe cubensis]KAH9478710.1 hypothetical protein JR316_0009170 [Psilocybe cubensis]